MTGATLPFVEGIYSIDRRDGDRWVVVHTLPGREERVVEALVGAGVTHYLPRLKRWQKQSKKQKHQKEPKRHVVRPLLPRYLFAALPVTDDGLDPGILAAVAHADGVHVVLRDDRGPLQVAGRLIEVISEREAAGDFDDTVSKKRRRNKRRMRTITVHKWAVEGAHVQVMKGPFAQFFAVVEEVVSEGRLKVGVSIFGRHTPMELDVDDVRAAA